MGAMAMAQRDRLIEVAARVKALRDELQRAEAELDGLLNGAPSELLSRRKAPSKGVAARALAAVLAEPTRVFSAETLAPELGVENVNTVRSTLSRLAINGAIEKIERGQYRAPRNGAALAEGATM